MAAREKIKNEDLGGGARIKGLNHTIKETYKIRQKIMISAKRIRHRCLLNSLKDEDLLSFLK